MLATIQTANMFFFRGNVHRHLLVALFVSVMALPAAAGGGVAEFETVEVEFSVELEIVMMEGRDGSRRVRRVVCQRTGTAFSSSPSLPESRTFAGTSEHSKRNGIGRPLLT